MILAIDIGNTNVKLGVFDNKTMISSFRFASIEGKTAEEYAVSVRSYFANAFANPNLSMENIENIILSSVIPSMNYTFEHMCDLAFNKKPLVVTPKLDLGITIGYDNAKELGTDRIAVCVAAYEKYSKDLDVDNGNSLDERSPLIIVDFGTATTLNCVDKDGVFVGGMICPGIRCAAESLTNSTAKLPRFEFVTPEEIIGKSTVSNLQAGLFYGFEGLVKNIIEKSKAQPGFENARVIATGGFANLLAENINFDIIDKELSLYGLYHIYMRNKENI